MNDEKVLLKKGWRSDTIWTHPFFYKSPLKYIPFLADARALLRSQYWPRERLERISRARLTELLKDAARVPYWREILERAGIANLAPPDALARLPVIGKSDPMSKPLEYVADTTLLPRSNPDHTSGSTGKPLHFYQDWQASLRSFAVTERIFRTTGTRYPIIFLRARERNGFTFFRHVWFYVRSFSSIPYRMRDLEALGKQFKRGFILYAYTSWVVELARQIETLGMRLPIRAVMTAGEHLLPEERTYVERSMGAPVFTLYASREVGFLGFECERHAMHINEEWALIEIVDEKGRVLPSGEEGRVVVTAFDNRVMPFIRYDIGDRGVISDTPCGCGRTLKTIEFKGRTVELIELEDNRVVSLLDIAYAVGSFRDSVRQYQIIQKAKMSFVIAVVPGPQFEHKREQLELLMIRMFHPKVQIRWEIRESIPEGKSGKAVYFIRDMNGA